MRQRVEIIKCLRRDPEILVFDEPTSVLSPAESQFLFAALRRVVEDEGKAVALVSHKLAEVISASDEITIMRDGKVVDSRPTAGSDPATLARAMVGRDVVLRREHAAFGVVDESAPAATATAQPIGKPVLVVSDASVTGRDGRILLDKFSARGARRGDRRRRRCRGQRPTHARRRAVEPVPARRTGTSRSTVGRWPPGKQEPWPAQASR